jgi:hypothetical protein
MYTSAIAKEITVRDIDRSCKNLHGNEKKTWEKKSVYIQNVLLRR